MNWHSNEACVDGKSFDWSERCRRRKVVESEEIVIHRQRPKLSDKLLIGSTISIRLHSVVRERFPEMLYKSREVSYYSKYTNCQISIAAVSYVLL